MRSLFNRPRGGLSPRREGGLQVVHGGAVRDGLHLDGVAGAAGLGVGDALGGSGLTAGACLEQSANGGNEQNGNRSQCLRFAHVWFAQNGGRTEANSFVQCDTIHT